MKENPCLHWIRLPVQDQVQCGARLFLWKVLAVLGPGRNALQNAAHEGLRFSLRGGGRIAHQCSKVERVKGIEPSLSAWEAEVLPLNYTRFSLILLGATLVCLHFVAKLSESQPPPPWRALDQQSEGRYYDLGAKS